MLLCLPNGVNYEYKYDALNRLSSLAEYYKGGPILGAYAYTRGPTGILLGEQGLNGSDTFTWTYDAAYRLTGETRVNFGTTTYQASYSYDAVGNRTSATINGQTTNYTYNRLDQLTSTSAGAQDSYDGRGNLTQITLGSSTTSYSYDAADRLTRVTLPNGTSASYAYDAAGRRVQQTVGTSVTNYLWDEASTSGDVVQETDGNGVTQASYVLGDDELLAQTRSGAVSYDLSDGQNNVRLLTDGNGAVTDHYTYDAYGNLLSSQGTTVNPYRYTGQQLDSLTGLYDLRARYYDPTSGRFLSRDTAGIDVSNPVEVNRYSYAQDDPINLIDPSGHDATDEDAGILSAIISAFQKLPPLWKIVTVVAVTFIAALLTTAGIITAIGLLTGSGPGTSPQPQPGGASGQPPAKTPPTASPCPPDQPGPRASNRELEQGAQLAKQVAIQDGVWGATDWEFDLGLSRAEGYGPLKHPYIRGKDQNNNPICYDTRYYLVFENQITGDLYKVSANFCSISRVWDVTAFHFSTFQP